MKAYTLKLVYIWAFIISSVCGSMMVVEPGKLRPHDLTDLNLPAKLHIKKYGAPDVLNPVVCIPGVGGNQLFARLNKTKAKFMCDKTSDWFRIWLTLTELVPGPLACFEENIPLEYDNVTKLFHNATGVEIIPVNFGSTDSFEYLDPDAKSPSIYFAKVVSNLLTLGYEHGKNLFGNPFDWRLAPNSIPNFAGDLQLLIENAFYSNNNTQVIVIAHSMGNLNFKFFLDGTPQSWRDKFIKEYVAVSSPWTGAVEAIQSVASGYNFAIPFLPPIRARKIQRSFESNYFLWPEPTVWGDHVMVSTPARNYTAQDYKVLMQDLNLTDAYEIWLRTDDLSRVLTAPPKVKTYCLWGTGVPTHLGISFPDVKFDKQPTLILGDGDGTVPTVSASACQSWNATAPSGQFMSKSYYKADHIGILTNLGFLSDLLKIVTGVEA